MSFNFLELTRGQGHVASSTAEDGTGNCVYKLKGVDDNTAPKVEQIGEFATYLCGGVDNIDPKATEHTDGNAGKIRRRMPKLHPFLKELSIAGITKIEGEGDGEAANSMQALGVPSVTDQFWHYQTYNFTAEFKRRPYFLLPDELIKRNRRTYTRPDGTDVDVYYAEEWRRFTTTTLAPTNDTVNATTGGQMKFRSTGPVDGFQYPGQVWVYMQNQILEMNWFLVPYRYFFKHGGNKPYLTRFVNTVNQFEIMGFDPGQLLFLGATPTPFLPQSTNVIKMLGIGVFESQSQLCNVKMRWLATSRESSDVPAAGTAGLANKNNIANGHNLQPSFTDRKFHYVTTEDVAAPLDDTKWRASFPSFPHELLFTDPMLAQAGDIY